MGMDRFGLALQLDRAEWREIHASAEHPLGCRGDQHVARLRSRLQACGRVEHVRRDPSLRGRGLVGERLPAVDRDPDPDPDVGVVDLAVELGGGLSHLERGPHGAKRVVLVGFRHAEGAHHGVPDELLDRASVPLDRGAHGVEVAVEHLAEDLGVESLPELGRADQVAEERCDEAATGLTRRRQRGAAFLAELRAIAVLVYRRKNK